MNFRTDMAYELRESYMKEYGQEHKGEPDGISYKENCYNGVVISEIDVKNENGEQILQKPIGKYVTMNVGKLWQTDAANFRKNADILSNEISKLCKNTKTTLVAGLGNRYVTADAIGPLSVKHVIATHHISKTEVYKNSGLGDVAVISPGVLSQTGYEAAEQIKAASSVIKPTQIIIIDALAAKSIDTLSVAVQITNSGISPGSGVGNNRGELSERVLGVPTVAIGVPTIVDASTLLYSAAKEYNEEKAKELKGCFVCPKDSDRSVDEMARLIGYAVNRLCHKNLSYDDMAYI